MKLKEIADGINIVEVFNTKIPINQWRSNDPGQLLGDITIDDKQYVVILEMIAYNINNVNKTAVNIAFDRIIGNKRVTDLTNDTFSPKIMGAIFNAALDKINEYHFDAIVFMAINNVDKRMSFYNRIAHWLSKQYGAMIPDLPLPNGGKLTIVCNAHVSEEEVEQIKQLVNKLNS